MTQRKVASRLRKLAARVLGHKGCSPTSPELAAFLAAEDLDDLLFAREEITVVGAEDETCIRAILADWMEPQAVSNLLFHPLLIPEDIRLPALFWGLYESKVPYYNLAAVVGFHSIDPASLAELDRQRVLNDLLSAMHATTDIRAQCASISFRGFGLC